MVTRSRLERMREVLAARLGHVRCAAEALYHRHNVSAVLRTCDALGIHRVHLVGEQFVATTGASRGAERWLQIAEHPTAEEAVHAIKAAGFRLWVADLADPPVAPEEVPVEEPICLWVGAELSGVSDVVREAADGIVTVPMRGFTQSLNVSVAAALALRPIAERARARGPAALLSADEQHGIYAEWEAREADERRGIAARAHLRLEK